MEDPANTDISSLRPVIARSWRRSVMSSVNPFKSMPDSVRDHQIDSQFLKLANPIIRELEYLCLDTNGCVSLSDTSGTLALFRGSATSMRWADSIFPIVGGSMAEELVGTNSDGTALEEGRAVQVWGRSILTQPSLTCVVHLYRSETLLDAQFEVLSAFHSPQPLFKISIHAQYY